MSGRREYWPGDSYHGRKPNLGEITATGCWPGLLNVEESDRLRALLCDPARTRTNTRSARYMLSGVFTCNRCGAKM